MKLVIKEVEYSYSFGLGFLGECLENLDLSVFEIGKKLDRNPFKWTPILMYESIKYTNDGEIDITIKEFVNQLDEDVNGAKVMNEFLIAFVASLQKDVPKQEGVVENKKAPKKK
jgi:hypothetical protein